MKRKSLNPNHRRAGFTLTELMVASGLSLFLLTGFVSGFLSHRRTFHHKNHQQELHQNVRTAMMFLQRDLRYAGSGLVMGFLNLDDWFGVGSDINSIPWIVPGGSDPDRLLMIGISGEPVARLTQMVLEGDTNLHLYITDPSVLPYLPIAGDVLLLAGLEAVVVEEVVSGTHVRVSRDPNTPGVGVHLIYPVGTDVFQLNVVEYSVGPVDGVPALLRNDSRFTFGSDADKVIADGIESFRVSRSGNVVNVELTGRSRNVIAGFPGDSGDGLLRFTVQSENRIRNTAPRLSIQGWPSDILLADAGTPPPPPPPPPPPEDDGENGDGGNEDEEEEVEDEDDEEEEEDGDDEWEWVEDDDPPGAGNSGNVPPGQVRRPKQK